MARKIGLRLKKLREISRFSLDFAAKSVGISKQTLFKYENDKITNIPSDKISSTLSNFSSLYYGMGRRSRCPKRI